MNVVYAFLTDGLDYEAKSKFDVALEGPGADTKAKAQRERAAVAAARRFMRQ